MPNQLGRIQREEHLSPTTEFVKGQTPWNKGIVYEQILGEKHPQWKGGKPDCVDCGVKLKKYTSKRCSPCHLKSDDFRSAIRAAQTANTGIVGHRKGAKATPEQLIRIREAAAKRRGKPAWNSGITAKEDSRILSGADNPAWLGGRKTENELQRTRFRQTVLPQVLKRDNYTCQICDTNGVYLHVDHIKRWSEYPELRFDINNCRTLCMACHYYVTFRRKLPEGKVWGIVPSRGIA